MQQGNHRGSDTASPSNRKRVPSKPGQSRKGTHTLVDPLKRSKSTVQSYIRTIQCFAVTKKPEIIDNLSTEDKAIALTMKATAEARALANPTPTRRRRATPATARPPPQRPRRRRRVYASSSSSDVSTDAEQDDMYEEEDDEEEEIVQQPSEVLHQEGGVTPVCNVGGEKVQQDIQPAGCVELCSAIKDDAHGVTPTMPPPPASSTINPMPRLHAAPILITPAGPSILLPTLSCNSLDFPLGLLQGTPATSISTMTIPGGGGVAGASVTGHLVGGVHAMGGMHSMAGGHGTVIGHPSGFPGPLTWTPWGVPLAPAGGRRSDEGATGLTAVANPWAALSSGGGWGGGWSREASTTQQASTQQGVIPPIHTQSLDTSQQPHNLFATTSLLQHAPSIALLPTAASALLPLHMMIDDLLVHAPTDQRGGGCGDNGGSALALTTHDKANGDQTQPTKTHEQQQPLAAGAAAGSEQVLGPRLVDCLGDSTRWSLGWLGNNPTASGLQMLSDLLHGLGGESGSVAPKGDV